MKKPLENTSIKIWMKKLKRIARQTKMEPWQFTSNFYWVSINHTNLLKTTLIFCSRRISSALLRSILASPNSIQSQSCSWSLIIGYLANSMEASISSSNQQSFTLFMKKDPHTHPNIFHKWIFWTLSTIWSKLKEPTCGLLIKKSAVFVMRPFLIR